MVMKWTRNNVDGLMVYTCEIGITRFVIWNLGRNGARLFVQTKVPTQLNTGVWVDMWSFSKIAERLCSNVRMAKEYAEYYLEFGTLCGR